MHHVGLARGGDHDDRRHAVPVLRADLAAEVDPVRSRQVNVEQERLERTLGRLEQGNSFLGAGGEGQIGLTLSGKAVPQQVLDDRIIIDGQYSHLVPVSLGYARMLGRISVWFTYRG